jgi:hypothetical protein
MTAASSQYASFVRQQFGDYRPVWLPTTLVAPGDILSLGQDGTFQHLGSLSSNQATKDVPLVAREGTAPFQLEFIASKGCSITAKASGETNIQLPNIPQASAGFSISFAGAGDLTITATNATEAYIENLLEVESNLRELLSVHQWDPGLIVAAKVIQAESFTLFLSESDNSKVEVSLSGTLTPAVPEIGKVGVGIDVANSAGNVLSIGPLSGVTPLAIGVRLVPIFPDAHRVFHVV